MQTARLPRLGRLAGAWLITVVVVACAGPAVGTGRPPTSPEPDSPKLSAMNVAFDRTEITVPASRPFLLVFLNNENLPHNVAIYRDAAMQDLVFEGEYFSGPAARLYSVPALAPGIYTFNCKIHPIPAMTGTMLAL